MPSRLQFLRDTPAGQLLRALGYQSWLPYPEEADAFQVPRFTTVTSEVLPEGDLTLEKTSSKVSAIAHVPQSEISRRFSENGICDVSIVHWYENDPENPRNWSNLKKNWTLLVIVLYTFVVYGGASIIAPTAEFVMARYHVSPDVANLGLSMYIVGCKLESQFPLTVAFPLLTWVRPFRWHWPHVLLSHQRDTLRRAQSTLPVFLRSLLHHIARPGDGRQLFCHRGPPIPARSLWKSCPRERSSIH